MIESTTKDGVAVLAMRHGKANALDIELCQALCGALDDAVAGGAAAVVLTGAGAVFRDVFGWSLERSNKWLLANASAAVLR